MLQCSRFTVFKRKVSEILKEMTAEWKGRTYDVPELLCKLESGMHQEKLTKVQVGG